MRKKILLLAGTTLLAASILVFKPFKSFEASENETGENEEYEKLEERYKQLFDQMKDPATGDVPSDRLIAANNYAKNQRVSSANNTAALNWVERGPNADAVGPSNGNGRGGASMTAGIVQTFLVDANDPTGNTVLAGSPSGGLWRCTNFVSTAVPNWAPVNDFQANLAIASICQNPTSPNIMYIATGDANTRDVRGYGIWKSTDYGVTWSVLPSTTTFTFAFKILCDNAGNVYAALGGGSTTGGLRRSTDGGTTWTQITPTGLTASNPYYVTDIELSSTGRLHGAFGYYGTKVQHFYTDNPATVTSASGWTQSYGIRLSSVSCTRLEIAAQGNTLYAVTGNSAMNIDSCYKSIDGGATWTLQNTAIYTSSLGTGQVWYACTLSINPDDASQFIVGGLDAYKSFDNGATINRLTYWVSNTPYVHADHHTMQWFKVGTESRVIVGCDGGIFLSRDGGASWQDRNQNLRLKQFYSCAISPTAGVNYLLAGAQDNGTHQLQGAGMSSSLEVTGGDGAYVHINQQNPQIQFGAYIYNQFRRSTNGGATWSSVNLSGSTGNFINQWDYDDATNTLYACNAGSSANNQFRRWDNANTTNTSTVFTVTELIRNGSNGNATAFKPSVNVANRLFIGGSNGKVLRLENASTVTSSADITANITDLTSASFPTGNINCINTGTSDNTLIAVFTNYGVNNVWYSTDAGATWTAIDGNLPDMPVWWAVFEPGSNTKVILATESGVWSTSAVNGGSTVWTNDNTFPLVRTTMMQIRPSDNTIVASTYGRGLFTAQFNATCSAAAINTQPSNQTGCAGGSVTFSVSASGTGLGYQWRKGGVNISGATSASLTLNNITAADIANYDVVITGTCGNATSTTASLSLAAATSISSQPVAQSSCVGGAVTLTVGASGSGLTYQWRKGGTAITGATSSSLTLNSVSATDAGNYDVVITGACGVSTSNAVAVTVNAATSVVFQPATQTVCTGNALSLTVTAAGTGTLSYQWRKNGTNITGATSATYTIPAAAAGDAGSYDAVITGTCGSVTSNPAVITVSSQSGSGCTTAVPTVDPDVTQLVLMPNVARSSSILRINVRRAMSISWTVIDANGRAIMTFNQKVTAGQHDLTLELAKLQSGNYYLSGTTDKGRLGLLKFQKL